MGSTNRIKSLVTERIQGFLLTRQWRDADSGVELEYWFATADGPVCARVGGERSVFFLRSAELELARPVLAAERGVEQRELELRAFDLGPVVGL